MFRSVLVANRGEIARRIFRTARRLGVETIAVASDADLDAAHVREADRAVRIGPAPAAESYLSIPDLVAAALESGAEAVHPGYGFLSENAAFAEAVQAAGLIWIGPSPEAIRAMGLKDSARERMIAAGVPVTPGWQGDDGQEGTLLAAARDLGWPVLIKAAAGGGGRGIRRVDAAADFAAALAACRREALAAFGDDRVLLEQCIEAPRHIEVQVFGDAHGGLVHLFERDCTLQRRRQKVIEEAPAPGMTPEVRDAVCAAALAAARAVDYVGAGTVEFIADAREGLRADRIWFMEMNTRLQVEHPVTEAVTGVDLVEWQFHVAAGEPLPLAQDQITLKGWAVEARLCAEVPERGFIPSVGPLEHLRLPEGVRVDSGVEAGDEVGPHYDSLIAKLIAWAPTREGATEHLAEACAGVETWPLKTNAAFLARCLDDPDFLAGRMDTGFIDARLDRLAAPARPSAGLLRNAAAALAALSAGEASAPSRALSGFRLNAPPRDQVRVWCDGVEVVADLQEGEDEEADLLDLGEALVLFEGGSAFCVSAGPPAPEGGAATTGDGAVSAPLPGRIVAVAVAEGDRVRRGDVLLVVEAMKMEHSLTAPFDGVVDGLSAAVGDQVREGEPLARVRSEAP
ncbi:acetyl/propionyl/methylcrotonyl-CoA carboxylase subunit alpha [Phenylobacterium parvum]|uniref:Methylcrotonoyl-CoA carboxylase n=1 Tax=Phenylobacterium parvum TaxID=2201350 RepID=A0A2Z3HIK4_9CAUL|nr:biotin carboxylase N-terminal domain-containing protein [Phenylobacterium parvum]AWM76343.1 methylcrotonoyl-CoA carboxylase [Phenylobacterium parvum]